MDEWPEGLRELLSETTTMALGTVDPDGRARVTPLFFLADSRLGLYWLSAPTTRHSANIARDGRASAAVFPSVRDWRDIRGLETDGPASHVSGGAERDRVMEAYRLRFALPPALDGLLASATVYRLLPSHARWLDNRVAFGHRVDCAPDPAGNTDPADFVLD